MPAGLRRPPITKRLHQALALLADLHYLAGPHRTLLYGTIACSLLVALTDAAVAVVTVAAASLFLGNSQMPELFHWAKGLLQGGPPGEALHRSIITVALGMLFRQLVAVAVNSLTTLATQRIADSVRRRVMDNITGASTAFLLREKSSHIVQVAATHTSYVVPVTVQLSNLVAQSLSACLMVSLLLIYSLPLTAILAALGVAATPLKLLSSRAIYRHSLRAADGNLTLAHHITGTVQGVRHVKLQNRQGEFAERLAKLSQMVEALNIRVSLLVSWENAVIYLAALAAILILTVAAPATGLGQPDFLVAYFYLLYRLVPMLGEASGAFNRVLSRQPMLAQVLRYVRLPDDVRERQGGDRLPAGPVQSIRFENVSFSYDGAKVLEKVSLALRRGEVVALAGVSGAGKSTLMHLLCALFDPEEGRILIDGRDSRTLNLTSLRDAIGLVSQDVYLFDTTIAGVIRGSRAEMSDEEVRENARRAHVADFIEALPQGYRTKVGERGALLSGGQRQRLFLAQTLARHPPVIVLDEATSAVDMATEAGILEDIRENARDCIVVVVTHRLHTLLCADRILMLEEGRIVEEGSYEELMARRGSFWELGNRNADADTC